MKGQATIEITEGDLDGEYSINVVFNNNVQSSFDAGNISHLIANSMIGLFDDYIKYLETETEGD